MNQIELDMPSEPLFVGSYARLPLRYDPAELKLDDLDFIFSDGLASGLVSLSQESHDFKEGDVTIMLLTGYQPGSHHITVTSKATGDILFEADFEITALWTDESTGHSNWFTGQFGNVFEAAAWGGGQPGPQNMSLFPATGIRRIAIVFVDSASQRYTTDPIELAALERRWRDEVLDGIDDDGILASVRRYYREVSFDNFDISAQFFGPFSLPGSFDDYIKADGKTKGGYIQAAVTAVGGNVNYDLFDSVAFVMRGIDGPNPQSAHPYGTTEKHGPFATPDGDKMFHWLSLPHESPLFEIYEDFLHELGHNLGLQDQRDPGVTGRMLDLWEPMANYKDVPHFCLAHRMMLSWVDAAWIRSFNFQTTGQPVDEVLQLSPIETGEPPAGHLMGIEIRLADGWNYYFEYRLAQDGQMGDQKLPENGIVLATDVLRDPNISPIARPWILLTPQIGSSDGAVLSAGESFIQDDLTTPNFPVRLNVTVESADATRAQLRVKYSVLAKPDPSIRPWPAGENRRYQSPDIEVQNSRNLADPIWFNTPMRGEDNTIIASVRNRGKLDAPGVRVDFFVKNFNVGGNMPPTFLGSDTQDIPEGATVEFKSFWRPGAGDHFCLMTIIPLYQTPDPARIMEITELNNRAQSNYVRFISDTSSPSLRHVALIEVGNPFKARTRVFIVPRQDNPVFRTYLEHQWLMLDPGETRRVAIMFEYAAALVQGNVLLTDPSNTAIQSFKRLPNRLTFSGYAEDPTHSPPRSVQLVGGVDIEVAMGRAVRFTEFALSGRNVKGLVLTRDTLEPAPAGKIIIITTNVNERFYQTHESPEFQNGVFDVTIPEKSDSVRGWYLPAPGFGEAFSDIISI